MNESILAKAGRAILKRTRFGHKEDLARRCPQHKIGPGTYDDLSVIAWGSDADLTTGAYTSVASGVKVFLGGKHRIDWATTYPFNVL